MVNPWEWQEHCLLVTIRNRATNAVAYLLDHVSQEEFVERYVELWQRDNAAQMIEMTVMPLTPESHELLAPFYDKTRKMEG